MWNFLIASPRGGEQKAWNHKINSIFWWMNLFCVPLAHSPRFIQIFMFTQSMQNGNIINTEWKRCRLRRNLEGESEYFLINTIFQYAISPIVTVLAISMLLSSPKGRVSYLGEGNSIIMEFSPCQDKFSCRKLDEASWLFLEEIFKV